MYVSPASKKLQIILVKWKIEPDISDDSEAEILSRLMSWPMHNSYFLFYYICLFICYCFFELQLVGILKPTTDVTLKSFPNLPETFLQRLGIHNKWIPGER